MISKNPQKLGTVLRKVFEKTPSEYQFSTDDPLLKNILDSEAKESSIVKELSEAFQGEGRVDSPLRNIVVNIWTRLNSVGDYYCGLFIPRSKNKNFCDEIYFIWDILIRKAILGTVYVAYGQEYLDLDKQNKSSDLDFNDIRGWSKFRLYAKESDGKYYSLLARASISFEGKEHEEKFIKFNMGDSNFWLQWWHVLYEYIGGMERVKDMALFTPIRTIAAYGESDTSLINELKSAKESPYPVLVKPGGVASLNNSQLTTNEYEAHEFVPPDLPKIMFEFWNGYFDIMTDNLGYSGRGTPIKNERLMKLESMQSIGVLCSVQHYIAKRLTTSFNVLRFVYNKSSEVIPWDFEVSINSKQAWDTIIDNRNIDQYLKNQSNSNNFKYSKKEWRQ